MQSRCGGTSQLRETVAYEVRCARELGEREPGDLPAHDLDLRVGRIEDGQCFIARDSRQDDEIAQTLKQVRGEAPWIMTRVDDPVDDGEEPRALARGDGVHGVVEQGRIRHAELGRDFVMGEALRAGAGDELTQDRQGIAHAARGTAGDQRQGGGIGGHALGLADRRKVLLEHARGHEAECVIEGARADSGDDLVGLGRGEDEAHVVGWLLHELEQRVEARVGDHVGLVDDVDLVAGRDGGEHRALAQFPSVVDAAMARGVQLDDVDGPGAVGRQVDAALALPAGLGRGALGAVERAGQDAGGRGLAAAAGAGQQVGVVHAVARQGAGEGLGDVLLAHHVGQAPRPIGAVEGRGHLVTLAPGQVLPGPDEVGPPAHPTEPACPCCLPALGDSAG